MKTRIISGIVMGVIVAAVLAAGLLWNAAVIAVFVALLAVGAVYELTHNVAKIKSRAALIGACVYAFLATFTMLFDWIKYPHFILISSFRTAQDEWGYKLSALAVITIVYFVYSVIMVLANHKEMTLGAIGTLCAMPLFVVGAFSCLGSVINYENGLYYLLMLFNFSSICDMGAYFVGVTCGKHKLCPEISPKKTVEGAIGGIVSAVVFALVFMFAFSQTEKLVSTLILTVPLCIVGMMGDLFASSIKRSVGLKDYSNLIPGHGGVLDRVDSILLIAPVMYLCMLFGVL